MLAQMLSNLMVKDLKTANSILKYSQSLYAVFFYPKSEYKEYSLVSYADASTKGPQEGCIVFKMYGLKKGSALHPIAWHSRKMETRSISTLGYEALACSNAFSVSFYLRHFLKECLSAEIKKCTMVTDSKSLFQNMQTYNDVTDKRLKKCILHFYDKLLMISILTK